MARMASKLEQGGKYIHWYMLTWTFLYTVFAKVLSGRCQENFMCIVCWKNSTFFFYWFCLLFWVYDWCEFSHELLLQRKLSFPDIVARFMWSCIASHTQDYMAMCSYTQDCSWSCLINNDLFYKSEHCWKSGLCSQMVIIFILKKGALSYEVHVAQSQISYVLHEYSSPWELDLAQQT